MAHPGGCYTLVVVELSVLLHIHKVSVLNFGQNTAVRRYDMEASSTNKKVIATFFASFLLKLFSQIYFSQLDV